MDGGGGGGTWPKIMARERVQERGVPPPMHCAEAKLTYILESVWKAKKECTMAPKVLIKCA